MARSSPVNVWRTRHSPRRDPKFHQIERLHGAGRSISEEFTIRMRGCVFRIGWDIKLGDFKWS